MLVKENFALRYAPQKSLTQYVSQFASFIAESTRRILSIYGSGEIGRGAKRRVMNVSIGSENLTRSYFRTIYTPLLNRRNDYHPSS